MNLVQGFLFCTWLVPENSTIPLHWWGKWLVNKSRGVDDYSQSYIYHWISFIFRILLPSCNVGDLVDLFGVNTWVFCLAFSKVIESQGATCAKRNLKVRHYLSRSWAFSIQTTTSSISQHYLPPHLKSSRYVLEDFPSEIHHLSAFSTNNLNLVLSGPCL